MPTTSTDWLSLFLSSDSEVREGDEYYSEAYDSISDGIASPCPSDSDEECAAEHVRIRAKRKTSQQFKQERPDQQLRTPVRQISDTHSQLIGWTSPQSRIAQAHLARQSTLRYWLKKICKLKCLRDLEVLYFIGIAGRIETKRALQDRNKCSFHKEIALSPETGLTVGKSPSARLLSSWGKDFHLQQTNPNAAHKETRNGYGLNRLLLGVPVSRPHQLGKSASKTTHSASSIPKSSLWRSPAPFIAGYG